jgi:hypothetical protein
MRNISKLSVVLLVGIIAVLLLNTLVGLNPGTLLTPPAGSADSAGLATPTLRAPVQEVETNAHPDQNLTAFVTAFVFLIGLIGILLIVVNYPRWKKS